MTTTDRQELNWLQQRHSLIERDVAEVGKRITVLARRLEAALEPAPAPAPTVKVETLAPVVPPPLPPAAFAEVAHATVQVELVPSIETTSPVSDVVHQTAAASEPATQFPPVSTFPEKKSAEPAPATKPAVKGSFEMRLGTYWLVRIGIVMLLTSFVFLGNYAYKNFILHMGAAGKVTLLYIASGILLGLGKWLSRPHQRETVKNYAQVLFAGGLAAVYFTTYAAHYFPKMRVIANPVVDGILLLIWAGVMVWIADRRKSEVLALFAVGLAYYTSAITHIGLFTLYSNLVLTAASLFFLLRNRWTTLSFVSLVATYVGFLYWRFYSPQGWRWNGREDDLLFANIFLGGYWLMFTAAAFCSRVGQFTVGRRVSFVTLNNVALFLLVVLSMLEHRHGNFWKFSLIYGSVLCGLSLAARRWLADEPMVKNAYLNLGVVLITLGFISKFTGLKLALILATESVTLLMLGYYRANRWLKYGAAVTALLAAGWACFDMEKNTRELVLGAAVGAMLVFNAIWARRQTPESKADQMQPVAGFFAALGLGVWLVTLLVNATPLWRAPLLALATVVFTASYYPLRSRELTILGQVFLGVAVAVWGIARLGHPPLLPWWSPVIVIASLLAVGHWWQHQKVLPVKGEGGQFMQGMCAFALVGVVFLWLQPKFAPVNWLMFTSLLAVMVTAYGLATRAWFLAACGQFFLWISAFEFLRQIGSNDPAWFVTLTPIVTLIGTGLAVTAWLDRASEASGGVKESVRNVGTLYRIVALIMTLWWVYHYIPVREQFWTLSLLATALFALGGVFRSSEALIFSGIVYATGWLWLLTMGGPNRPFIYGANLAAILLPALLQRISRRVGGRVALPDAAHVGMMITAGLGGWLYLSRWVADATGGHFYFTASWAVLALAVFGTGFAVRERTYRWLGLAILACALGRVVFLDVWRLETIYRILSFFALGVVLLVLSFIYSKYEEKIKEWL